MICIRDSVNYDLKSINTLLKQNVKSANNHFVSADGGYLSGDCKSAVEKVLHGLVSNEFFIRTRC